MKRIGRILALLLVGAMLFSTFASCNAARRVYATPRAGKTVATVGDVKILYEEIYYIAMNRIAECKKEKGEQVFDSEEEREALSAFVWDAVKSRETALLSLGYRYGINVYDGDIADNVQHYLEDLVAELYKGDRGAYIDSLQEAHLTDHLLRAYIGLEDYLATEIVLEMLYRGELDSSDSAALARIQSDDFIRTIHVFIKRNNPYNSFTDEENLQHAKEIAATLAAAPTDSARHTAMLEAIGGAYNSDFNDISGNGYYFAKGEMEEVYENAAFALEEYAASDVVTTNEGYYIIMRMPKSEDYIRQNFEKLKQQSYFIILNQKVAEIEAGLSVEKTKFGASLDLLNLPAINADGGTFLPILGGVAVVLVAGGIVALVTVLSVKKSKNKKKNKTAG